MTTQGLRRGVTMLMAAAVLASAGCQIPRRQPIQAIENQPKELSKTTLQEYIIEPPDVLQIDLVAAVPKPPYRLQPLDGISISTPLGGGGLLPDFPLRGVFQIDTDGTVNLGSAYGAPVQVVGMTIAEAKEAMVTALKRTVASPQIDVYLAQSRGMQQVRGPHLVRPDGTVWFDIYGAVRVVGLTMPQARAAVEEHLSKFFVKPEVALSVTGFNSKVYYVIFESNFGGAGIVYRLPVTGNECVLDVISQVGGMSPVADYRRIWISRPAPPGSCPQKLPVDWRAITEDANVATNYQILPGDRLFVKTAPMVTLGARIDRFLQPIERVMGFYLLGQGIVEQSQQNRIGQQILN